MFDFKILAYRYLPNTILRFVKKVYYYKKLVKINEYAEEDLLMLKDLIKKGDQVFDIGANFGVYTKIMSQLVGNTGKVYSFEPIPYTHKYLVYNVKKLKLNNVIPINMAISDKKGKAKMEIPTYSNAGENYYEARITEKSDNKLKIFEINSDTLDNLYLTYNFKPSFIKCDVEGHEWFVFKEGKSLLSMHRPILLIEINQNINLPDDRTTQLIEFLKSMGYGIYINFQGKLKKFKDEKKVNYYFLKEEHLLKIAK